MKTKKPALGRLDYSVTTTERLQCGRGDRAPYERTVTATYDALPKAFEAPY
jgi:hypothetical protein